MMPGVSRTPGPTCTWLQILGQSSICSMAGASRSSAKAKRSLRSSRPSLRPSRLWTVVPMPAPWRCSVHLCTIAVDQLAAQPSTILKPPALAYPPGPPNQAHRSPPRNRGICPVNLPVSSFPRANVACAIASFHNLFFDRKEAIPRRPLPTPSEIPMISICKPQIGLRRCA